MDAALQFLADVSTLAEQWPLFLFFSRSLLFQFFLCLCRVCSNREVDCIPEREISVANLISLVSLKNRTSLFLGPVMIGDHRYIFFLYFVEALSNSIVQNVSLFKICSRLFTDQKNKLRRKNVFYGNLVVKQIS